MKRLIVLLSLIFLVARPATASVFDDRATILASLEVTAADPPRFLAAFALPPHCRNSGMPVLLLATLDRRFPVREVWIDLSAWGRDSAVFKPFPGSGSRWYASLRVDSAVPPGRYDLPVFARDVAGLVGSDSIRLTVHESLPSWCRFVAPRGEDSRTPLVGGHALSLLARSTRPLAAVLFEYRPVPSDTWLPCHPVARGGAPGSNGPRRLEGERLSGLAWDLADLPEAEYEVRARGVDDDGASDPDPEILRVRLDSAGATIRETLAGDALVQRRFFARAESETATLFDGTWLFVPQGGLDTDAWIQVTTFASAPPEAPAPGATSGLIDLGYFRRFVRENGPSSFARPVIIGFFCPGLPPGSRPAVYRFDPALGTWVKEEHTFYDAEASTVYALVAHFTDFAVFGAAAAPSLRDVIVYPNPFVPYDGNAQNGVPFVRGDNASGIIFGNVTASVDIEIYNVAGRRVATIHAANTGGSVQWDARGDDMTEVASGVYIAIIRSNAGEIATRKFMIIR